MTPVKADVDVGVVTWNTRELTVSALRRVLDTEQGCRVRLLVRDNGSSDGTARAIAVDVPEAELDAGQVNLGFARGMNTLLARSDAPYFLALNSDAWPEPGAVGALVEAASRVTTAAAVAPRLLRPDGTLEHSTHPFPSIKVAGLYATGAYRLLGRQRLDDLQLEGYWLHDRARPVDWAIGAALLMRRTAVEQAGGFDERFFMYAEDLEWCWRARRRGWEIWFEPAAVVRHVGNASGARHYRERRAEASARNAYRFFREEHGPVATAAYRACNLAGATRRAVAAKWRGRDGDARFWAREARSHLVPAGGQDGPPW
jgi:GT2 family glycosyltransferase